MTAAFSLSSAKETSRSARIVHEGVIERIFEHNEDTRSLFLRLPVGQSLPFSPGQFLSLLLPIAGQLLTRAYSIASDPESENLLEICFNLVPDGPGSRYLFERQTGEVLQFTGPWGAFVLEQPLQTEYVFVADGVGIAPIRPMIKRALAGGTEKPIRLIYSAMQEEALLYRSELQTLARHSVQFSFDPLLLKPSARWSGLTGNLMETVAKQFIDADQERNRHFYICGVGSQVTALRDLLRQAGYLRRAVQYEKW